MDSFSYRNGELWCEDVPAADLAARFGTPLYVYSRATLEGHYDRLSAAFADLRPLICFSVKSCPNVGIGRVLVERGAGMDVVSGGELERAWLAGCPMDRIVYAGVGKTDAEIRAALDGRASLLSPSLRLSVSSSLPPRGPIGLFNIESEPEFEAVARLAREAGVRARGALRINPDVDPRTHAYTATGKKETKFGVDLSRAARFFERYGRDEWLRLDAVHLHIGSPVYEIAPYVEAVTKTLALIDDLAAKGFTVRTLDLGGGFAADYETEKSPRAADYAAAIVPLLRGRVAKGLQIILEPGRQISANAGVLLTRVLYVKDGAMVTANAAPTSTRHDTKDPASSLRLSVSPSLPKRFLICDAGMQTLIRPALYGSFHFIWPARVPPALVPARRAERPDLPGLSPADVVGPICESSDFLAKDRPLPPVSAGELLTVFGAGAYGMSMASRYNSHPFPAEVLVEGSAARLVRRRETVTDLILHETD